MVLVVTLEIFTFPPLPSVFFLVSTKYNGTLFDDTSALIVSIEIILFFTIFFWQSFSETMFFSIESEM